MHILHFLLRFCPWITTSLWGLTHWWRSTSTHIVRKHPPSSPVASSTRSESSFEGFIWIQKPGLLCVWIFILTHRWCLWICWFIVRNINKTKCFVLIPTFLFPQAVYFLYGTKDCLVQECKDLDKRIEVKYPCSCNESFVFILFSRLQFTKRNRQYQPMFSLYDILG